MFDFTKKFGFTFTRTRNTDPELRMSAALVPFLEKSDLIVDIGANHGQFLELVLKNYTGQVIAIEPEPKAFEFLSQKFGKLSNVQSLNLALGSSNGRANLNVANNSSESSSILDMGYQHKIGAPNIKIIEKCDVKLARFSDAIDISRFHEVFLKIDVQGFELEVLKGISSEDLKKILAIKIELNVVETYVGAPLIETVMGFLRANGFSPLRIENGFGLPGFGQQLQMEALFIRSI
jgi:FkbM family methyltransferase